MRMVVWEIFYLFRYPYRIFVFILLLLVTLLFRFRLGVGKNFLSKRTQATDLHLSRSYPSTEVYCSNVSYKMKKQKSNNQNTKSQATKAKVGHKKMTGRKTANAKKNPIQKVGSKINAPQKLKAISQKAKKVEPTFVAKGAAAVSIAAGVLAAGAIMADKDNRKKAGKIAVKGMEFIQEVAANASEEVQGKYQAVQMTIPLKGKSDSRSSGTASGHKKQNRGRSKSK